MHSNDTLHVGYYRKYLMHPENLLVITGDFGPVRESRRMYEQRHGITPTPDDRLDRLMGACALAAASLADRESWGWTVTLPGMDTGWFCGTEPEGPVCGRRSPAPPDAARAVVQRQQTGGPLTQSHFTPPDGRPEKAVEAYFLQVVQTVTRIELDEDASGILVQALPGGLVEPLLECPKETFLKDIRRRIADEQWKPLREFLVFYECRCDNAMIDRMLDTLTPEQREDLWGGSDTLTIECPRCGRGYTLRRTSGS